MSDDKCSLTVGDIVTTPFRELQETKRRRVLEVVKRRSDGRWVARVEGIEDRMIDASWFNIVEDDGDEGRVS